MANHSTLSVALGDRSYPIVIGQGLLDQFPIGEHCSGKSLLIVTNETVGPLYLERLRANLGGAVDVVSLADGECYKTLESVETIIDRLVARHAGRDTTVIALGGGVVGDIAGFAAACYMRGVALIQVPTSLLAQVDSSVGGKTGVNHPHGKNLIGAFHQPNLVLIDIDTLSTLPEREFKAGLAEIIKYGAIVDIDFFGWLEANLPALLKKDHEALTYAITHCCRLKAGVVAADERESGSRALLNFGHTFGHAIENSLGYGEWLHGEAVAAGMIMAAELSELDKEEQRRLRELIKAAGLPIAPPPVGANKMRSAMELDKKAEGNRLRFVLLRKLGKAFVTADYSSERLDQILEAS